VDFAFAVAGVPFLIAGWRWISVDPAGADWAQLGRNLGAYIALILLWRFIRNVNTRTAQALTEEIETVKGKAADKAP